ncbi:HAD-IC family P-type ATPase [Adlercreutzia agrestimuris]|uniref:HAD-IC family P-type ATPase n=1 Tax=Adlercreutzia agrestimuris TaxID=2941324 RepID=UPI00204086CF|nr:HAD-IC family P-type ATPase [Adlercreutzia agrestimuris]
MLVEGVCAATVSQTSEPPQGAFRHAFYNGESDAYQINRNRALMDIQGLSAQQVEAARQAGQINVDTSVKSRSYGQIARENICTLFNAVNFILAVLVFLTGSYKNMLFMLVIVINTIIGIVQEIRSKITTDKLAILTESVITAMRDGKEVEVPAHELVLGDVIKLGRGDQVPADALVVDGECQANESLLTGESKMIRKTVNDELMSGSFINAGSVWARVEHVGADNYAAKITNEAKQRKAINSEIVTSLNAIIKFVSIGMFPIGILLFCITYFSHGVAWDSAILSTVSALVGMIPEGLILLTSTVLAVAVIRLAKHQVLVQQLYCIETLARVDVLCLDKTGTITTGAMKVVSVEPITAGADVAAAPGGGVTPDVVSVTQAGEIFASLAASDEDPNETAQALQHYFANTPKQKATRVIPFSSDRKYSGATLADGNSYVMGATQFVLASAPEALAQVQLQLDELAKRSRVLVLARVPGFDENGAIIKATSQITPLAFICIEDEIRPTAAQTIRYFIDQGVTLKVISGDDPATVSGIAERVGIPHAQAYVDAATLTSDEAIDQAMDTYAVFGRVRPEQKKAFVLALQKRGHTVAMTGDGVNDVLALKASDCSVAMASGSDAARNVAQLVLVDNDFASMPRVVAEGRRAINNLQRSASLFLVKTLLSITLAVIFILLPWQYPFVPIQMTLISAFTIGLPSFVLALQPNHDIVRGKFLTNCVVHSIPGALCAVVSVLLTCAVGYNIFHMNYGEVSTVCVLLLACIGVLLVIRLSLPFNALRVALLVVILVGLMGCVCLLGHLFDIASFTPAMLGLLGVLGAANIVAFNCIYTALDAYHLKKLNVK